MTEHASHTLRGNSMQAYDALRSTQRLSARQRLIVGALRGAIVPMKDREIAQKLRFSDMNAVRPRVNELLKAGVLEELPSKRDPLTGMKVRRVGIKPGVERAV